ncbi:MAG: NADP-dependent oxidoreductase [Rhodospirillaceae bacterium]|nr:NADP-dependent oxidoreductase [Rhodospirillaceae bacterium]
MNSPTRNTQIQLSRQRDGMPDLDDFEVHVVPTPEIADGEFLVRTIYLSLDPYIRKAMRGDHPGHAKLAPGEVIYGRAVCRIVRSRHADYKQGDYLVAETGWQNFAALTPKKVVQRIDPTLGPLSTALGVLGMPGLTAWGSVAHIAQPNVGDTFVVSAAAGPVGGTAGQLAKQAGARVVGIAGGKEKCDLVTRTYGFDACIDYKKSGWQDALAAACPGGIDIYHDNVGASLLNDLVKFFNLYARVVLCGRPADYHSGDFEGLSIGPIIGKRAVVRGMVVYDYEHDLARYQRVAAQLMREGKLRFKEDRVEGVESTPAHFLKLMRGENIGKAIVSVGPEKG